MIKSVLQHWLWHLAADLSPLVPRDLTKLLGVLRNCNKTSVSFIAVATWRTQPKLSWPECYLSVETAAFLIAAVRIVGTSTASKVLCKHHCGPRTPACKDVPFEGVPWCGDGFPMVCRQEGRRSGKSLQACQPLHRCFLPLPCGRTAVPLGHADPGRQRVPPRGLDDGGQLSRALPSAWQLTRQLHLAVPLTSVL